MSPHTSTSLPARHRPPYVAPQQLVLRVTLREIEPAIWRLLRIPDSFTLHQVHRTLQIVFSWLDYHMYEFQVDDRRFQEPDAEADDDTEDATTVRLADLDLGAGARFTYVYDFGDDWVHDVVVERLLPMPQNNGPDWSPRLLDGARAAPPEDAGGPSGYDRLLEALGDPNHPEHDDCRAWAGGQYEPTRFDSWSLDRALALASAWGAI